VVLGTWLAVGDRSAPARSTTRRPASVAPSASSPSTGGARGIARSGSPSSQPTTNAADVVGDGLIPAETLVAGIPRAGVPGSRTPGGPSTLTVPGQWLGAPSILPVIGQRSGWDEVRLAQRPNESTAWVRASDLRLYTDAYRIVVNLSSMHLDLFNQGHEIGDFPAGIGVGSAPTPTGHFFLALFAESPSSGYGPFVIVTSAHSDTISDWEESGDAITAVHGPLGADAAIGTTGARVSHGCIRLHNQDLAQLRDVPAGTPIDIVG
jgi:L,D-transpeptidase-like protein